MRVFELGGLPKVYADLLNGFFHALFIPICRRSGTRGEEKPFPPLFAFAPASRLHDVRSFVPKRRTNGDFDRTLREE